MSTIQDTDKAIQFITEVRTGIHANYGDTKSAAHYWQNSGLDALILSTPDHSGKPEEIAREVYHRLTARLIATHIVALQKSALMRGVIGAFVAEILLLLLVVIVGPLAFISPNLGKSIAPLLPIVYFAIPIGLIIYARSVLSMAPQQIQRLPISKIKEEALGVVRRCFLRAIPAGTPSDLADVWRHSWFTNECRPISSELVETDAASMVAGETASDWRSCYSALLFSAAVALLCPCIFPFLVFMLLKSNGQNPGVVRSQELDRRRAVEGSALVAAGGILWARHQEQARIKQISESMDDNSPVVSIGTSTGILAARGDCYAPSAELPFDLSLRDLQNHLLIFGGTGSGKTSGVLRPLAHQIAESENIGLVVMDGKSALPSELANLSGMQLVDPAKSKFSLVAGLSPAELVDTLVDVLLTGSESDPYWSNSAAGLLRRSAVLARHAGGAWWTLEGIGKIATSAEALAEIQETLTVEIIMNDPILEEAVHFFANEWMNIDSKPKSSVVSHAMTWISTITAHPDLLAWAQTESGSDSFDLFTPLTGGRIGFLIPAHRYGTAGAAVTALLKARLYSKIKERAERKLEDSETPIVFIIDEAQEVATKDDATMLSIGRSLGLAMVAATQTVEGVTEKLGEKTSAKWLAVFGNTVALTNRSRATDEFIAKRAGSSWKPTVRSVPGMSVKDSVLSGVFSGSSAAARKQPTMRQFAVAPPSPLAPFTEKARTAPKESTPINTDPRYHRETDEGVTSSVEPVSLIFAEELPTLLAEPNLALAITIRARVPRRDVIMLTPKF